MVFLTERDARRAVPLYRQIAGRNLHPRTNRVERRGLPVVQATTPSAETKTSIGRMRMDFILPLCGTRSMCGQMNMLLQHGRAGAKPKRRALLAPFCLRLRRERRRLRFGHGARVPRGSADEYFSGALALTTCAAFGEVCLERGDVGAGDADRAHELLFADAEPPRPVLHRMPVANVDGRCVPNAGLGRRRFRGDR